MSSYVCSVCNGLEALGGSCPSCRQAAEDRGRLSDYDDPYSPYRSIDDMKLTNGFADLERHQCVHMAYCPGCGATFTLSVQEQER
ncbi:hypothetical protein P9314_26595 [Paenibacillus validus]|uniref:Uncharacterized protein n=1 Tax=Paenibacillus validus TaxID=44253 RepID=A0A7X3CU81_9BACL|nr:MULTISPECIES: hypothetical protein [Paenibacillus]MED4604201.1 hypothetical protein [Paenibacillus validus]MED4609581.1 hypothetical protein [Paenibacillus validus]MUG71877.1 hypothetical protein [Paenibacillus validus]